jgi:mannose-6-phosphate isomerase-like protein (cupin superfamily)
MAKITPSTCRLVTCAAVSVLAQISLHEGFAQDVPAAAATDRPARGSRASVTAWTLKPIKPGVYVPPNKPLWKLTDILAKHAAKTDWAEPVVRDEDVFVQYISLGPGKKTPTSLETDTLVWFIIKRGQARFLIQGQQPFVATKDFIVQVPKRTAYSVETVGDEPSLRLEVREAGYSTAFPVDDNPTPPKAPPGFTYIKAQVGGAPNPYSDAVKPYLDFQKEIVHGPPRPGGAPFFVRDGRGFAAVIRGKGGPPPEPANIGHFHSGVAEFWLVMEGEVYVQIEGVQPLVVGHDGDVIYAPRGTFHRAGIGGTGMGTRLGMGGQPDSGAAITLVDQN